MKKEQHLLQEVLKIVYANDPEKLATLNEVMKNISDIQDVNFINDELRLKNLSLSEALKLNEFDYDELAKNNGWVNLDGSTFKPSKIYNWRPPELKKTGWKYTANSTASDLITAATTEPLISLSIAKENVAKYANSPNYMNILANEYVRVLDNRSRATDFLMNGLAGGSKYIGRLDALIGIYKNISIFRPAAPNGPDVPTA